MQKLLFDIEIGEISRPNSVSNQNQYTKEQIVAMLTDYLPRDVLDGIIDYVNGLHGKAEEIEKRAREETTRRERAEADANRDPMTNLYNKRYLKDEFSRQVGVVNRSLYGNDKQTRPLSVLLMDIDNFKALNDKVGHPEGDYAIKFLARILEKYVTRPLDTTYRIGGDEFLVLLPDTDREGAQAVANKIKARAQRVLERLGGRLPEEAMWVADALGVSVGIATAENTTTPANLLKTADEDLRARKKEKPFNYRDVDQSLRTEPVKIIRRLKPYEVEPIARIAAPREDEEQQEGSRIEG